VVGQRLEVLFPEAERAASMEQIARTLRGEFWELIEISILHQSSEVRRVLWNSANIAGPDDRPVVATIAQGTDITERKRAEETLRESEERFRDLYDNAPNAYFSVGADSAIRQCNRRAAELLGYTVEELVGRRVFELYADTPQGKAKASKIFERFRAGEAIHDEELQMQKADGSPVWISLTVNAVRDLSGQIAESRSMVVDITERKKEQEALRDSERRFRTLSEASFEGTAIHRKGTMLEANPALAAMFGYELSEAIRMHVLDFVAPESRDAVLQSIVSKSREPFEFTGLKKDGTTFPVEVCGRPIPYQGKMVTVAALRDITEHKQAEEALQKAREELENRVERQMERGNPYGLTFRELTVLHVVAAGKADKEIASQLGITTLTASKHLANILDKMGAASRTEACVRALREGLLD